MMTFLYYQFSRRDQDTADWFYDRLKDGVGVEYDEPVYRLRERLIKNRLDAKAKLPLKEVMALVIKANGQRLCTHCHNSVKQSEERGGGRDIEADDSGPARASDFVVREFLRFRHGRLKDGPERTETETVQDVRAPGRAPVGGR